MTAFTLTVIALMTVISFCEGFNMKILMDRLDNIESRLEIRRQEIAIVYEKISVIDSLEAKVQKLTEEKGKDFQSISNGVENQDVVQPRDISVNIGDVKDVLFNAFRKEKKRNEIMHEDYKQFKDEVKMSLKNQTQTFNAKLGTLSDSIYIMTSSLHNVEAATEKLEIRVNKTTNIGQQNINGVNEKLEKVTDDINTMNSTLVDVKDSTKRVEIQVNKYTGIVFNITSLQADFESKVEQLQRNNEVLIENQGLLWNRTFPSDSCITLRKMGHSNGLFQIRTSIQKQYFQVYCDQETDGGSWIVFQRRKDGSVDFNRNWNDYKLGFGDLEGEFWLGNEYLSVLTSDGTYELRIDMENFDGNRADAKYSNFKIHPESDNYRLEVSGYSGDAGDSLAYHNNVPFSTNDNFNDGNDNCKKYNSGWWFKNCYHANLNGEYFQRKPPSEFLGIIWWHWLGTSQTVKFTEMKFRKT